MKQRGFTLLEALIALAVFSVIMSILYLSLSSSINAMDKAEVSARTLQEGRSALDNLRRELESAFYSPDRDQTIFRFMEKDLFGRAAAELEFTSFSYFTRGLFVIAYKAQEIKGRLTLLKKIYPTGSSPENHQWETLIEDLHSFSFQVYNDGELVKTWDSSLTRSVPVEVRIAIGLITPSDSAQQRPYILMDTVRIRINRVLQE